MTDSFLKNRTRIISIAQNKNIDKSINVHVAIWQNVFIETTNKNEKKIIMKKNKNIVVGTKYKYYKIKTRQKLVVGTKI